MLKTNNPTKLRYKIDQLPMPLFIADLHHGQPEFEFRALNRAHEQVTGMKMEKIVNRPLSEVFSPSQANDINGRFCRCINDNAPLRCRERLQTPLGMIEWDITLYAVDLPDRVRRVIGSARVNREAKRDARDVTALEDVEYFTATSTMRIRQLAAVFASLDQRAIAPDALYSSANILEGLCHSLSETLDQMRSIVKERLTDRQPTQAVIHQHCASAQSQLNALDTVMTTLVYGSRGDGPLPTAREPLARHTSLF
jgi:hypothetical protein